MPRHHIPKRITPQMVRDKIADVDLLDTQVYRALDIPKAWFNRMIQPNRHQFLEPNPERMREIWKFLIKYETFKEQFGE